MRKQVKTQLQEIMADLVQTAGGLERLLNGLGREEASDLLMQMQELVLQAGNTIEASEGSENAAVRQLEDACELIYQLNCDIECPEAGVRSRIPGEIGKIFADVGGFIEKEIRAKREVVFLSYQVSMWDALESVWMAAEADEDTEAYVVPVPFYDVLPDGSLGEMHYQGDCYPYYVPVTPYQKYSIEDRQPDMIFIHNPYDQYNRVTRVPERYYASHLKKYTEMLVYIPYFVSEEGGPADLQCSLPGVLYADRVVVQPGSIYEKYCRVYTDTLRQNRWEKLFLPAEQKFLPLGSPKVDKLLNTNIETEALPESWKKVLLKSDGSRKKVIFYNLSISPLLQNREQTLKKLDSVFEFFRQRKEECVLLWRPHPLLINTIYSMVPWLRDAYMERVRRFKEEGWGIYDETPEPHLAMALSDGYYGDESSLLTVYRETGKPILVQDVYQLDYTN